MKQTLTLAFLLQFLSFIALSQSLEWAYHFGAPASNSFEFANDVVVSTTGNIYVAGRKTGDVDFDASDGTSILPFNGANAFLASYTIEGALRWAIQVQAIPGEISTAYKLYLDEAENIYVAGQFEGAIDFDPGPGQAVGTSTGVGDNGFVAKYNSSGEFLDLWYFPSTRRSQVTDVQLDQNDNIVIVGNFTDTIDLDPGPSEMLHTYHPETSPGNYRWDIFMVKLNPDGNYQWSSSFGGPSTERVIEFSINNKNQLYLTGFFQNTTDFDPSSELEELTADGSNDIFMAQYTDEGQLDWVKQIGDSGSDVAFSIKTDPKSNIYISGWFKGTVDFDPGPDFAPLTGNGFFNNGFLAKYDSVGNYDWSIPILSGLGGDIAYDVNLDEESNVYVTGVFGNTIDFDPGPNTANLTAVSNAINHFAAKYDRFGQYKWAFNIGGRGNDDAYAIAPFQNKVVLTGLMKDSLDADPQESSLWLTTSGLNDANIFLGTYTQPDVVISSNRTSPIERLWQIFPNPAKDYINIKMTPFSELTTLKLISSNGQVKGTWDLTNPLQTIPLSGLPSGVYFLQCTINAYVWTEKLLILD